MRVRQPILSLLRSRILCCSVMLKKATLYCAARKISRILDMEEKGSEGAVSDFAYRILLLTSGGTDESFGGATFLTKALTAWRRTCDGGSQHANKIRCRGLFPHKRSASGTWRRVGRRMGD